MLYEVITRPYMARKITTPEVLDAASDMEQLQQAAAAHSVAVNKALGVTEYNLDVITSYSIHYTKLYDLLLM